MDSESLSDVSNNNEFQQNIWMSNVTDIWECDIENNECYLETFLYKTFLLQKIRNLNSWVVQLKI